jgi:hypothetical protein
VDDSSGCASRPWRSRRRIGAAAALLLVTLGLSSCYNDNYCCVSVINVPNSIAIADVNGDGVPDLLVATTANQGFYDNPGFANVILNSKGSPGTFSPGVHYPSTGYNPASIAVGDLTGAGALDLVIASITGNVSIYPPGSTPGTFQPAVNLVTGGAPNQVVIADVDGDGAQDLVLADFSGSVIVLYQDPANPGQFSAPVSMPTGLTTASVAVADLNGDGAADIVATGYDSSGNNGVVLVFYQLPAQRRTFMSPVSFPAGAGPQSVKVADMNGDGRPDLVVANFGPGTDGAGIPGVSILLQDPGGSFLAPASYQTAGGSLDVAVGDLNGDGKPDVAVAGLAPAPSASISVLLQDAAHPGMLLAATTYPGFGQPLGVAIGDLNGDGLADIAAADGSSATVMLQLSGKPGQFAPAVQVGQ